MSSMLSLNFISLLFRIGKEKKKNKLIFSSSRLSTESNSQIGYQIFLTFSKFLENSGKENLIKLTLLAEKLKVMILELKQNPDHEYNYPK